VAHSGLYTERIRIPRGHFQDVGREFACIAQHKKNRTKIVATTQYTRFLDSKCTQNAFEAAPPRRPEPAGGAHSAPQAQWRNRLTGGPWTNYIKGSIPHFEFTEQFIIIKVLTKITIKHKTMMKCEVDVCKGVRCPPIFSLSNLIDAGWL